MAGESSAPIKVLHSTSLPDVMIRQLEMNVILANRDHSENSRPC